MLLGLPVQAYENVSLLALPRGVAGGAGLHAPAAGHRRTRPSALRDKQQSLARESDSDPASSYSCFSTVAIGVGRWRDVPGSRRSGFGRALPTVPCRWGSGSRRRPALGRCARGLPPMPAASLVDAERFVRPGTCLRTDSLSQKTRSRGPEPRYERRSSDRPCARSLVWRYHLRAVDIPVGGRAFRIGAEKPRNLRCSQRNECIAKGNVQRGHGMTPVDELTS
jgi:hypothetical protein